MIKQIYKALVSEKRRIRIRMMLDRWISPIYAGKDFYCNCCEKSFRKMHTKAGRPNAQCPYCGSLERTRLLLHYLRKETNIFQKRQKVLHFGPEEGLFKILKNQDLEYIDADLNPACARHVVDITDIQYPDDYFDMIICVHVVSYIPDEEKAIQEMRRVLHPDGVAIILTYIDENAATTRDDTHINTPELRRIHYGEAECLRIHGRDFHEKLEAQGFKVEMVDYVEEFDEETRQRESLGVGDRERFYLGRK